MKLKNIDARLLQCFEVLINECNVTVAAERLQMSQGNMSNSLARLRELFGDALLVRSARGMVPTDHALELLPRVQSVLREITSLLESRDGQDIAAVSRTIRIACADATALTTFGPMLAEIGELAPNLQVEISQILNFRVKEPLSDGSTDLAIGAYPDLAETLNISRLIGGNIMCGVRADSGLAREMTLDCYTKAHHGVLSVGAGLRATVEMATDRALAEIGCERKVRLSSQYATVIADAAAHGDIVATMPDFMLKQFAKNLPLAIVPTPLNLPAFSLYIVWHKAKDDWVLQWFRQRLRQRLVLSRGKTSELVEYPET